MATNNLEERLAAVEAELAHLKKKVDGSDKPWWEHIVGRFAGDPYYEAAMRLGREWRESSRPTRKKKPSKKKNRRHVRT